MLHTKRINQRLTKLSQKLIAVPTGWYVGLLVLISSIARLIFITKADVWHDEGYTMMIIKLNPIEIIERTARDVHPPLYYLLTHWWQGVFGDGELAIRGLSAIFGVITVIIMYKLVSRLFNESAGRLAGLFVALGPFAVRYSDEARMYSLAALFVVLASYLLVLALQAKSKAWRLWILYGLTLAAGFYTHYYVAFIIPVHIAYAWWSMGGFRRLVRSSKWWTANIIGAGLFAPWVPVALAQNTRVQAGFWIPPVDANTLPDTLLQFATFNTWFVPKVIEVIILLTVAIAMFYFIYRYRESRRNQAFLIAWAIFPLIVVALISLGRPIYYDRYFTYCAIALYALAGIYITLSRALQRSPITKYLVSLAFVLIFIFGIIMVGAQANHQMGTIGRYVNQHYQPGDTIISAELYTYFDFSYFNQTGQTVHLLYADPMTGYGETSLLYTSENQIVVHALDQAPTSERIWLVGKTGDHDYYGKDIPASWRLLDTEQAGDSAVRLYRVTP